jgi:hypothetical protein
MDNIPTLVDSADFGVGAYSVEWSNDGKYLFVGGENGTSDLVIYSFDGAILVKIQDYDHGSDVRAIGVHDRFIAVGGNKNPDDLRVYAFNHDPIANDEPDIVIDEDTDIVIPVLENDMDQDGDSLSVVNVSSSLNGNATIMPGNMTVRYLPEPDWYGTVSFNYTISDVYGETANATVNITVLNINDPPVIITKDVTSVMEDTEFFVDYNAEDMDPMDALTWDVLTDAGFLVLNHTSGILSGTPGNDDVDAHFVNISVRDTNGASDHSNFTLEVINSNDRPTIILPDIFNATEDEHYSLQFDVVEIDQGDVLKWSMQTNANWISFNSEKLILNGTPVNDDVGSFYVNLTADDSNGGTDQVNFSLVVENVNDPPKILTVGITTVRENDAYLVDYEAVDIDPIDDDLLWSLETNASSWLFINPLTGVLSGTPSFNDSGTYRVSVSVSDGNGGVDWNNFTLHVEDVKVIIQEPEEEDIPLVLFWGEVDPIDGNTSTAFRFTVYFVDENGDGPDSISVIIDDIWFEMVLEDGIPSNGRYIYRTRLDEGTHTFYFNASSGELFGRTNDDTPITPERARAVVVRAPPIDDDVDIDDDHDLIEKGKSDNDITLILLLMYIIVLTGFVSISFLFSRERSTDVEEE